MFMEFGLGLIQVVAVATSHCLRSVSLEGGSAEVSAVSSARAVCTQLVAVLAVSVPENSVLSKVFPDMGGGMVGGWCAREETA